MAYSAKGLVKCVLLVPSDYSREGLFKCDYRGLESETA
jgi:hypothetical protein